MASRATLVVPCYNEARRLDVTAFRNGLRLTPSLDLLFVDDGSVDGTRARLEEFVGSEQDRARLLVLPGNHGKAEAVRRGVLEALVSAPEWIGYWDADLSTPLEAIVDFLAVGDGNPEVDIILGSRVALLGRDIRRRPYRHYFGRVFATAVSQVLGLPVYDTQCGAKLFRVSPRIAAAFQTPFTSRWVFDVELLSRYLDIVPDARVHHDNPRIYELALRRWHDVPGSKLRPWDPIRAAMDLWRIYRRRV